ncbi:hypothetical protein [Alteriqipengyuania sp. 357]
MMAVLLLGCSGTANGGTASVALPASDAERATRSAGSEATPAFEAPGGERNFDPTYQVPASAFLIDSAALKYRGSRSLALFLTGQRIVGYIDPRSGKKLLPDGTLCTLWERHLAAVMGGDTLVHCDDVALEGRLVGPGAQRELTGDMRYLSYRSERLSPVCNTFDECLGVPLDHSMIVDFPVCAIIIAHRFETADGEVIDLVEGTDQAVYGRMAEIGDLSNPDLSKFRFGKDYSILDTAEKCGEFVRSVWDE